MNKNVKQPNIELLRMKIGKQRKMKLNLQELSKYKFLGATYSDTMNNYMQCFNRERRRKCKNHLSLRNHKQSKDLNLLQYKSKVQIFWDCLINKKLLKNKFQYKGITCFAKKRLK